MVEGFDFIIILNVLRFYYFKKMAVLKIENLFVLLYELCFAAQSHPRKLPKAWSIVTMFWSACHMAAAS